MSCVTFALVVYKVVADIDNLFWNMHLDMAGSGAETSNMEDFVASS